MQAKEKNKTFKTWQLLFQSCNMAVTQNTSQTTLKNSSLICKNNQEKTYSNCRHKYRCVHTEEKRPTYTKGYFLCLSPWEAQHRCTGTIVNFKNDNSFATHSQQDSCLGSLLRQHMMKVNPIFCEPLTQLHRSRQWNLYEYEFKAITSFHTTRWILYTSL